MDPRARAVTDQLSLRTGALVDEIQAVAASLGVPPPADYVAFMTESNGADGPIGQTGYLALWPIEQLVDLNRAYAVHEFAPELALFGSDGGDTAYAFEKRTGNIVSVPFVGMAFEERALLGTSFVEFLEQIRT